jgi:hypothetical protein
MKNEIVIIKNPVVDLAIAIKPHKTKLLMESVEAKGEIAVAICSDLPIRSYEMETLKESIAVIVTQLLGDAGTSPERDDSAYLIGRVLRMIIKQYSSLTTKEIRLAFENGVLGDYGQMYGVNIKTCAQFLSGYSKSRGNFISKQYLQADIRRIEREDKAWREQKLNKHLKIRRK